MTDPNRFRPGVLLLIRKHDNSAELSNQML